MRFYAGAQGLLGLSDLRRTAFDFIRRVDPVLFICTLVLTGISLLTIWGAVDNFGARKLKMQIAMAVLGIIMTFVVANLDYHVILDRLSLFMLIFSVAILAITLVAGTTGENIETSNRSWLNIPIVNIAIQPSEFVKITFICTFAQHLTMVRDSINSVRTLLGLALHAGVIVGLILLSGDLGVALVYLAMIAILLFCAGLHWGWFAGAAGALLIGFPFLWNHLNAYQQDRIIVGFNPELDPLDKGWQALMSRQSIENGGFFGVGLGNSRQKFGYVSQPQNDYIYSVICEELGFVGAVIVIALFAVFVWRGYTIAMKAPDTFCKLTVIGIVTKVGIQALLNIAVVTNTIPNTGVTLPFFSYGGSALMILLLEMGIILAISRYSIEQK